MEDFLEKFMKPLCLLWNWETNEENKLFRGKKAQHDESNHKKESKDLKSNPTSAPHSAHRRCHRNVMRHIMRRKWIQRHAGCQEIECSGLRCEADAAQ